jgi:excinuclease ABC subunit A
LLRSNFVEGNTVVVIEHNFEVIKTADWIVDIVPQAARRQVYAACAVKCAAGRKPALERLSRTLIRDESSVATGTPEDVTKEKRSYTCAFLKPVLAEPDVRGRQWMQATE